MAQQGIAIIGAGMIGRAHSAAYHQFAHRFGGVGMALRNVCDTHPAQARELAEKYGFQQGASDWKQVIADPDIHAVPVCLPNFPHAEVTLAALRAGKHVLCEKPLALLADQARPVRDAAMVAGRVSGTVFNYRRIPALADINAPVDAAELGRPANLGAVSMRLRRRSDVAAFTAR